MSVLDGLPVTLLLALSSLLSRLLGIVRNHALATAFGATALSDAYFAAFQIPDTLYRFFVFGAISASFVPLFLTIFKKDRQEAFDFASSVMNFFTLGVSIFCIFLFFFSSPLVRLLYPEFSPELQETTSGLLKIMLLSPLFFTISSVFSGIQNAFRSFVGFALAPIIYNLGILFGIYVLAPLYGILGVAYGVVIGSILHAAIQIIPTAFLGFLWKPIFSFTPALRRLLILSLPRVFSMVGLQLMFFVEGIIATSLVAGDLTLLRFAQDIQSFPVGIIGVSIAISSFSVMTDFSLSGEVKALDSYVKERLEHLFFLLIPASFGMWVLQEPIVALLLGGGAFDQKAIADTASVLSVLTMGIPFMAIIPFLTRVFFSLHDTIRPLIMTLTAILFNTILALSFAKPFGVIGLGIAGSLTAFFAVLILFTFLRYFYGKKLRDLISFPSFFLFTGASLIMTVILKAVLTSFVFSPDLTALLFEILFLTLLGASIYGVLLFAVFGKRFSAMVKNVWQ